MWPPFLVLGLAALGAVIIGFLLGASLRGDLISLESWGYAAAFIGYFTYAPVFLLCDWFATRRLPERTWASKGAMYRRSFVAAVVALPLAFVVSVAYVGTMFKLRYVAPSVEEPFGLVGLLLFMFGIPAGLALDLRIRRRTHLVPTVSWDDDA
jgi:hypothetical protein